MPRCRRIGSQSPGTSAAIERLDERGSVAQDPVAHPGQVHFPAGPQSRVGEDRLHDVAAVGRRVRVVGADGDLEVAQGAWPPGSASAATTVSAPTRSLYRAKFFE